MSNIIFECFFILFENAFCLRKPSRPKSGDPMRMSLTLDIEDNTIINGIKLPYSCHINIVNR